MSELVTDCPRCGATKITFDLKEVNALGIRYDWQRRYETFCVCRNCDKATVFILCQKNPNSAPVFKSSRSLVDLNGMSINQIMNVEGFINIADIAAIEPPDHLPIEIKDIFNEGAKCKSVNCHNAAGTMFRLCVDIATKGLLPTEETLGLNAKTRRDLGLRLPWLFDNNVLPEGLRELSTCIKEDGNDGAHNGTLTTDDTDDLVEFTTALLERLYTEPEKLKIAKLRREERRTKK